MAKNKEVSSDVKSVIIQQWISGKIYRKLSINFKIPHTTVALIVGKQKRLKVQVLPYSVNETWDLKRKFYEWSKKIPK